LRPGWDGHGAAAITPAAKDAAFNFLRRVEGKFGSAVPEPFVAPLSDGGLGLVWRVKQKEIEIVFLERGNEYAVSFRNAAKPTIEGCNVDTDFLLTRVVDTHVVP
jgi:hypothetical protein